MTTIDTLPTMTASHILQTMKDATNQVIALALQQQADGLDEYIETRIDQLQRYISGFQEESLTAKGDRFSALHSMIGDYSARKMELITLQSNLRLGVYKPKTKETRK